MDFDGAVGDHADFLFRTVGSVDDSDPVLCGRIQICVMQFQWLVVERFSMIDPGDPQRAFRLFIGLLRLIALFETGL